MEKYEMISQIIEKYTEANTDSVTLQNARNYLTEQSEYEVQKTYDDVVTYSAKAKAFREGQILKIYKHSGLINDAHNDALLNVLLPGVLLNVEAFRSLVELNPVIKNRFHWINATEPFAEVKAKEQEQQAGAGQNETNFRNACRILAIAGTVNISPSLANWSLCRNAFGEEFPSLAKMLQVLGEGSVKGTSPNSPQTIAAWASDDLAQERQKLCHLIADAEIPAGPTRDERYRKLYASMYTTIDSLREKAEAITSRRKFARMSPEEIKQYLARERAGIEQPPEKVLPPEITKAAILRANSEQLRQWNSYYGSDLVTERLQGIS
jgi:hypothetical protein